MRCLQFGKHVRLSDLQNGCASTTLPWLGGRAVAVGREHLILHCLQPPPRTQTKCLIGIRVACHPPRLRSRKRPKPHPRTRSQAPRWRCCNKPNQPKCPNHPPPTMPLLRVGVRTMTGGFRQMGQNQQKGNWNDSPPSHPRKGGEWDAGRGAGCSGYESGRLR